MSTNGKIPFLMATFCFWGSFTQAEICKTSLSCGDCCASQCCPSEYCCQPETKSEKVTRHCFETECKPVVIPPVKLPCRKCTLKKLFCRGGCGTDEGCCADGRGCSDGCGPNGGGVLSRLCSKFTQCRIRCVNTYSKKDYECGTKCVTKWKAIPACDAGCSDARGCGAGAYCEPECSAPLIHTP